MNSKSLLEICKNGSFREALQLIEEEKIELGSNLSLKIIIACCNACHSNLSSLSKLVDKDLILLVKAAARTIGCLSRDQIVRYFQATYHIVKFLFEKENCKGVLDLEDLCVPCFEATITSDQFNDVKICYLFYNAVLMLTRKSIVEERLIEHLILLSIRMYKNFGDFTVLLLHCNDLLSVFVTINVKSEEKADFYYQMIRIIGKLDDSALLTPILNLCNTLAVNLLKDQQFDLFKKMWLVTSELFNSCQDRTVIILLKILKSLEWLPWMPPDHNEVDFNMIRTELNTSYRIFIATESFKASCNLILNVAISIAQHCKANMEDMEISLRQQVTYINFFLNLSSILAATPYTCEDACRIKVNINSSILCLWVVIGHLQTSLSHLSKSKKSLQMIAQCVDTYIGYLQVLKENACTKWKRTWGCFGPALYQISKDMLQIDVETGIYYYKKLISSYLKLEGPEFKIVNSNILKFSLAAMAETYLERCEYQKSMLASALLLIYFPDSTNAMNYWLKAKCASRDRKVEDNDATQKLTVLSIIDTMTDELKTYTTEQLKFDRTGVLILELKSYKSKWMNRLSVMTALKQLSKIRDLETAVETFFEILGDFNVLVHESIPLIVYNLTVKLEREEMPNKEHLLAYMYFLCYKYKMEDTIAKHCDEMEKTLNAEVIESDNRNDPNEKCDIFSSYEALSMSRYLTMTKDLQKSMEMCIKTKPENRFKLYKLATMIGQEYYLHLQKNKALRIFKFAFELAELERSEVHMFEAAASILDLSTMSESLRKLMSTVEAKEESLVTKTEYFAQLGNYFASKAQALLYIEVAEAYKAFKKAQFFMDKQVNYILKARLYMLQHHFNFLPCHYQIDGHQENSLVSIYLALNEAMKFYYDDSMRGTAYDMRIYFEVKETLVKMYYDLGLPRELRCYGKDLVLLAQKTVLPLRVVLVLYYLAYADLLSCRYDDCQVKVTGMSHILGLENYKLDLVQVKNPVDIADSLDVARKNTNPASPNLKCDRFQMPAFVCHDKHCFCFQCTSAEYQLFTVKKTLLVAVLYEHQLNIALAEEFFKGAFKIIRSSKMSLPSQIYCAVILEYANYLQRRNRISEAKDLNAKAISQIESNHLQLESVYLYNALLFQRLNIVIFEEEEEKIALETDVDENGSNDLNVAMMVHTPSPSKEQPPNLSPFIKPKVVEIVKIAPKSLKFDLTDSEDEVTPRKPTKTTRKTPKTYVKTPKPKLEVSEEGGTENLRRSTRNRGSKVKVNPAGKEEAKSQGVVKKYTNSRI